jgi:hypothetical protein
LREISDQRVVRRGNILLWITLHRVQPAPLILSLTQLKAIDTNG